LLLCRFRTDKIVDPIAAKIRLRPAALQRSHYAGILRSGAAVENSHVITPPPVHVFTPPGTSTHYDHPSAVNGSGKAIHFRRFNDAYCAIKKTRASLSSFCFFDRCAKCET